MKLFFTTHFILRMNLTPAAKNSPVSPQDRKILVSACRIWSEIGSETLSIRCQEIS